MTKVPQDTSAEEPDGGNLQVRLRRGPGSGDRPGLLNSETKPVRIVGVKPVRDYTLTVAFMNFGRGISRRHSFWSMKDRVIQVDADS
jgi:hypothetical protein